MATRYVDGKLTNPDDPQPNRQEETAPAPAQHPRGAIRVLYNTDTGETRVEESHATGGVVTPEAEKASARDGAGNPISLSSAGPNDVVTINGSDTLASVWEGMNMLRRLPGGGYEVIGAAVPATKDSKPEEKPLVEAEPAGDVRGVEGTSEATDRTMKTLEGSMGIEAIVSSLSTTGDISDALLSDLASQHNGDPEEFKADVLSAVEDHVRAGRQAIRNVDPTIDPLAFQTWLLKNPDLADKVTRGVMGKSVAEVQSAARQYSKALDTATEAGLESRGIPTKRLNGKLYVSRASLGLPVTKRGDFAGDMISVAEAIKLGNIVPPSNV